MNRMEEYLGEIRALSGLKNALLCGLTVYKRTATVEFFLVTDKAYTAMEEAQAREISNRYLPADLTAQVRIVKRVPDQAILKKKIYEYVCANFPAAAAFLEEDGIHVDILQSGANFCFDIASGEQSLFTSGKILDEVSAYLQSGFCGTFYGNVRIVEKNAPDASLLDEIPPSKEEETFAEIRRFTFVDFAKIDGGEGLPEKATYIADYLSEEGVFALCGAITYIEEKEYTKHNEKTGEDVQKSRFVLTVSDGTGNVRTTYFPKKASIEKIRSLKVGDSVVLLGENENFNGYRSFKTTKINFGALPRDFVPIARKGKPVPKNYHTVFPAPYVDYTQAGLFDSVEIPSDLKNNAFVVFDLETTGLNNNPAMGRMDKIIEIGAVKIVNGEMQEKFSTFVACEEKLSKEIVALTGIRDADLIGAPTIDRAIADFFKFIDGTLLVGHNVNFDYNFVRYYAEKNGFMIENKQYDTMLFAQELLRGEIPNYKLNSLADYYGFTFTHHRAFDDACVTAKIFIELMKKRGKLPY